METRIALVTGSSRNIGAQIAIHLAEMCEGVAVQYFSSREAAEGVVESISKKGSQGRAFQADLTHRNGAEGLVSDVLDEFGRIDILVNNFGPILVKPWPDVTPDEWEAIFRSNLLSAQQSIQAVLPGMRERKWGRIVNIGFSRVEQLTSFQSITPYAVAKTGLLIFTRSVAVSEASAGITVNMVSPRLMEGGVMPTAKNVPAGRLGKFEDVSSAVFFLASDKAGYITGTNIIVAGAWKL